MNSQTGSVPSSPKGNWSRRRLLAATGVGAGGALLAVGPSRLPPAAAATGSSSAAPVQLFSDQGFNYSALTALGAAGYGVTEVGEVLTAVNAINAVGATYDTYTDTFLSWGDKLAEQSAQATDAVTKGELALRASDYYAQALFYVLGTTEPGRELAIYQACRASWDVFAGTVKPAVQKLLIAYRGGHFPAWLFQPDRSNQPRPTLILTNGSDGQNVEIWAYGAAAGLQRGWNVLIYEGPGQGSTLFEQKIPFTDKWEEVVTPIVDRLVRHPSVDPRRIVLTGLSMGGDLAPRAAAFEHRLAALVCEPGVTSPWLGFSAPFRATITADKAATNDTWNTKTVPALMKPGAEAARYTLAKRYEPFGAAVLDAVRQGQLPTDIWTPSQIIQKLDITSTAPRITAPTLIINYEDEQFYPGQAQQLYSLITAPKDYVTLTAAEGANLHCSPMAPQRHNEVIFDWLENTLSRRDG